METLCMIGMMTYLSVEDIRKKTIPVIPLMIWGIVGVVQHLIYGRIDSYSMVAGVVPGIVAYMLSVATHEKIGKGDALLLIVTGIYMGFWMNMFMLWMGLILAAIVGVATMASFKKLKNNELPFVPFLSLSCLIIIIGNGGLPA